jgi:hypothetical protein
MQIQLSKDTAPVSLPRGIRFDGEQEIPGSKQQKAFCFTILDNSPAHGATLVWLMHGELSLAEKIDLMHSRFSDS